MLYFKTRALARSFAKRSDKYHVVDCADNLSAGRNYRWAVKVL